MIFQLTGFFCIDLVFLEKDIQIMKDINNC